MKTRVLVVDDAIFMRKMISDILEGNGMEVVGEADTGALAVEKYKELKPDLVTMDIIMPEMDGFETLEHIREISNVPVIMLTARGDVITLRVYWNSGSVSDPLPRRKNQSALEYHLRNWYYYTWLSGDFNTEQEKQLGGYSFLTGKPCFAILNSDEESYGGNTKVIEAIERSCPVVEFAGKFETELAGLDPDEAESWTAEEVVRRWMCERCHGGVNYRETFHLR